ncbi:MAG TPA: ABC transporter ATP-binding protein [Candidatus Limnocylindria bacterium]|nr:ABC transporter ATP-binding protein [Candidatus Limnocylindria bacterium]
MALAFEAPSVTPVDPISESVITMSGVSRRFGDLWALRDLSMEVAPGTILGLIGPSGSGKTTTIRLLTGTLQPTAGELRVLGEEPSRFSTHTREKIAYMPQLFSLYPDLTARENVGFVAALYGYSWFGREGRIRRALTTVDLWDARNRLARNLSGGEQRRLDLACAIVHEPSVLFIDEPTAGIDPMLRQSIWDELRAMRDAGATLLVTTQYVAEAEYCDNVAILADGQLVAIEAPDNLRRSVYGGELLQVDARQPVDPQLLAGIAEVTAVRQPAATRLIVVATDAGTASPQVSQAFAAAGIELVSIQEYQPTFDEVFTELVGRHRETNGSEELPDAA